MSRLTGLMRLPSSSQWAAGAKDWFFDQGAWWATSVVAHVAILTACLLCVSMTVPKPEGDAPAFSAVPLDTEIKTDEIKDFEVGQTPYEPTELSTETLSLVEAPSVDEQLNSSADDAFSEEGGGLAGATADMGGLSGF